MNYYLTKWRAETRLNNGQSLEAAHAHALQQLNPPPPNDSGQAGSAASAEDKRDNEDALAKLRADIWGNVYVEHLPPALAEAQLIGQLGIPSHIFLDDEFYTPEHRGYILARAIIDNQLELVRRVADTVRQNQKAWAQQQEQNQKRAKANASKPKKARKTKKYRRRR